MRFISLALLITAGSALAAGSGKRNVYLNGVDISSVKDQVMNQVNVRVDGLGNIYIDAPQYEVQQETTFLPIGKTPPSQFGSPEHKAPGPLPLDAEFANPNNLNKQSGLASPPDSMDTIDQGDQAATARSSSRPMAPKEGTRTPLNDESNRASPSGEIQSNPSKNP